MNFIPQQIKDTLTYLAGRRVHLREHMADDVVLLHRGAQTSVAAGHILDRCPIGFRVRHTLQLRPGDVVEVVWPSGEFITEVVWSEQTRTGCESGLRIQEEPQAA